MDVGEKIRRLRKARNMTQDDLADILGTDRSTISSYEIGRRKLSYKRAKQLATVFNQKIEYFFEGEENNKTYTFYVKDISKKQYQTLSAIYDNKDDDKKE